MSPKPRRIMHEHPVQAVLPSPYQEPWVTVVHELVPEGSVSGQVGEGAVSGTHLHRGGGHY